MTEAEPGARVWIIQNKVMLNQGKLVSVIIYDGYGTYEGTFSYPGPTRGFCNEGEYVPHLITEEGRSVWGCNCWWGKEENRPQWAGPPPAAPGWQDGRITHGGPAEPAPRHPA